MILVRAAYDASSDDFSVAILNKSMDGKSQFAKAMVFEPRPEKGAVAPTIAAHEDYGRAFLQACLDCAWGLGMRPTARDTSELTEALRANIQDLRHQLDGMKEIALAHISIMRQAA